MTIDELTERASRFVRPYRVTKGAKFSLSDFDPEDTAHLDSEDKPFAHEMLETGIAALAALQERLYAQDNWAVLLVFQAMDAAGKDSAIKHVMSGVNPQGCQVVSFKQPTAEDLDHDYLWRCMKRLPERGRIGIFNRSYYEETLIVRVHPELLQKQKIPPELVDPGRIWQERHEDITAFERYLARNGVAICKFFLHVSRKEQKKRFLERLEDPEKHWKFSAADLDERGHWKAYRKAYEETIRATATKHAPWYIVPADRKWFTRLVVAAAVIDTIASLDVQYPDPPEGFLEERAALKKRLLDED